MSAMFEFCCLRCEYAELHAPSSYRLDEFLILVITEASYRTSFIAPTNTASVLDVASSDSGTHDLVATVKSRCVQHRIRPRII